MLRNPLFLVPGDSGCRLAQHPYRAPDKLAAGASRDCEAKSRSVRRFGRSHMDCRRIHAFSASATRKQATCINNGNFCLRGSDCVWVYTIHHRSTHTLPASNLFSVERRRIDTHPMVNPRKNLRSKSSPHGFRDRRERKGRSQVGRLGAWRKDRS